MRVAQLASDVRVLLQAKEVATYSAKVQVCSMDSLGTAGCRPSTNLATWG
jgi:hypothetical protein